MIDALNHELITWLGYLQRGSVLLVFSVLSFFQILGSRESLSIIELGDVFGVTLTLGKLLSALAITYVIVAYAGRPAAGGLVGRHLSRPETPGATGP